LRDTPHFPAIFAGEDKIKPLSWLGLSVAVRRQVS
jgi:hypothetical protein